MQLVLPEQLLLLFLDDEKGSDKATWGGDPGLAGAILLELTAQGALADDDGRLVAVPGASPEHPLLAAAHAAIEASTKRRDAKGWVGHLPKELAPLRERLRAVLLSERQPTPQDAMLIALLIPYDLVKALVPRDRRKDARRRAKDVAEGGAAAKAVDASIKEIQAAVIASTTAAIAATAATSGS